MSLVKVGTRHQVVIPKSVRTSLRFKPGDYVEITVERQRAVIKPKKIVDRDEPIGPKTRAGIQQGLRDVAEGRVSKSLRTTGEIQSHLDALKKRS
jgi:AbrB family looped-hinge helix DNA binding protein